MLKEDFDALTMRDIADAIEYAPALSIFILRAATRRDSSYVRSFSTR